MVAPASLHFFRWTEQLKDAGHDVYWFDVLDGGEQVSRISWVKQIVDWKLRFNYPGRYFIKERFYTFYNFIQKFNEHDVAKVFEQKLLEIQPDVVHSFALYISCAPIFKVMKKYKSIKWIYSCWGSDLFYFQNDSKYLKDIKKVLPRVNYLFTDCKRDYEIAKKWGFQAEFLGVFPGGGGFDLKSMEKYKLPIEKRKTILVKGFQGRSGRAISVLKAIISLKEELLGYSIKVFGSDKETFEYFYTSTLKDWGNSEIIGKISRDEVLELMGESLIYIGNSNSDGMPNTLLEAICMGVFPIQSNPGGATAEIIDDGANGILIEDCENVEEIAATINKALGLVNVHKKTNVELVDSLGSLLIKKIVLEKYNF